MAGTNYSNHQPLAGMKDNDFFKPKGFVAAKLPATALPKSRRPKVLGDLDPNYQTLPGLNNEDVFKPKPRNYESLQKISALIMK